MTAPVTTNGDARHAAVAAWREAAAAGTPLTGRELADQFDRSPSWGRGVVREARSHEIAATHPAVAAAVERHDDGTQTAAAEASPSWEDRAITLVVAVVAAAASYRHMHDVALLAGEPLWIARAWPITVDGLVLAALRRGKRGRGWLVLGLAVSVAANIVGQFPDVAASAGPVISAWPPVALYGTHRLLHLR